MEAQEKAGIKPWLRFYDEGVPASIDYPPVPLDRLLAESAAKYPDHPAIIFGGLDSVAGAIIGGFIVGILEKMAGGYIDPKFAEITPYVILLLILLIRPEGLFGLKRIERI